MTKPTAEAIAFRALMDKEKDDWPPELLRAGTFLRCELDIMHTKHWDHPNVGGPEHLKKYSDAFWRLYNEWKAKR